MFSKTCGDCLGFFRKKIESKNEVENVRTDSPKPNSPVVPLHWGTAADGSREHWDMKIDFILSCVGFAVGLGNIWRFPFKVLSNGGGTFLIAYLLMLYGMAMPVFLIEIVISQFSNCGVTQCWDFVPGLKGIGFTMMMMSILCAIYYNLIVGWSIYYLINSFRVTFPWISCNNWWNDKNCVRSDFSGILISNTSSEMSSEQFWLRNVITRVEPIDMNTYKVLTISDNPETIVWYTALSMLAAWIICAGIVMYGIKVSGKAMWVFSTFPYVVITIMVIIGITLDGSIIGLKFYFMVDFARLWDLKIWEAAAEQIFYSLGIGFGGMITYGSYNNFNDNIHRGVFIVATINSATSLYAGFAIFSLLGNMAHRHGKTFDEMFQYAGDGLIFIAYPEVLSTFKGAHILCVLFFLMIFSLGIDSQIGMVETFITGVLDEFPQIRPKRVAFVWIVHLLCYLLALIMTTKTGYFWFTIFSYYAVALNLLIVGFLECVAFTFLYGLTNIERDYQIMVGSGLNIYWKFCMMILIPPITLFLTIYSMYAWVPTVIGYGATKVNFPLWADLLGWLMFSITLIPVPIYFIYYLIKIKSENNISFVEAFHKSVSTSMNWGPSSKESWLSDGFYRQKYEDFKNDPNFIFYEAEVEQKPLDISEMHNISNKV